MAKRGRKKFRFTPQDIELILSLSGRGMTDEQICDYLGVGHTTFYKNKQANTELTEALKKGRAKGISNVTGVLYNKCMAGDITAIIFYCKTRANMKETTVNELTGKDGRPIEVTYETAKDRLLARLFKKDAAEGSEGSFGEDDG
jgi:hypothetical protein